MSNEAGPEVIADLIHDMNEIRSRCISVEQAAAILGISRNHAYDSVRNGEIPGIRIGKRVLVPIAKLKKMLGEASEALDEESAA